jgi:hypothetical protein
LGLAEQLGVWPQARSEALEILAQNNHTGILIEIALDEGDVGRALELLSQVSPGH